ncbi:DNA-binding protein [Chitinophaga sp. G-6-1-13]|uniref:DNA-binding protein n=1 Tax=Chitinophaga fulva TaxID=2728842 RepID=A0A848GSH5_9BACT|nr:DNA-binding protein [Chitinophaga fulva]NML40309.1 DNA-binding protein [Chitinophaga fulva]
MFHHLHDAMAKKSAPLPPGDFPKLAQPALRALHGAGYTSLQQLRSVAESSLKQLHGMGPNAIAAIKAALAAKGWSLAPEQH